MRTLHLEIPPSNGHANRSIRPLLTLQSELARQHTMYGVIGSPKWASPVTKVFNINIIAFVLGRVENEQITTLGLAHFCPLSYPPFLFIMSTSRSLLVFALQLAPSVLAAAAGLTPNLQPRHEDSRPSCKAVPGSPDWPSPQVWNRFNESLAGRLLQPTPPGAVCHSGQGAINSTECAAVRTGWSTYEFHQADPVSVDWNNWTNDTCLPIEGAPCSGQGYPIFVINATEARHVQLGVQFGKTINNPYLGTRTDAR